MSELKDLQREAIAKYSKVTVDKKSRPLLDHINYLWLLHDLQGTFRDLEWIQSGEASVEKVRKRCMDCSKEQRAAVNKHRFPKHHDKRPNEWQGLFPESISWSNMKQRLVYNAEKKKTRYKEDSDFDRQERTANDELQTLYNWNVLQGIERVNLTSMIGSRTHLRLFYGALVYKKAVQPIRDNNDLTKCTDGWWYKQETSWMQFGQHIEETKVKPPTKTQPRRRRTYESFDKLWTEEDGRNVAQKGARFQRYFKREMGWYTGTLVKEVENNPGTWWVSFDDGDKFPIPDDTENEELDNNIPTWYRKVGTFESCDDHTLIPWKKNIPTYARFQHILDGILMKGTVVEKDDDIVVFYDVRIGPKNDATTTLKQTEDLYVETSPIPLDIHTRLMARLDDAPNHFAVERTVRKDPPKKNDWIWVKYKDNKYYRGRVYDRDRSGDPYVQYQFDDNETLLKKSTKYWKEVDPKKHPSKKLEEEMKKTMEKAINMAKRLKPSQPQQRILRSNEHYVKYHNGEEDWISNKEWKERGVSFDFKLYETKVGQDIFPYVERPNGETYVVIPDSFDQHMNKTLIDITSKDNDPIEEFFANKLKTLVPRKEIAHVETNIFCPFRLFQASPGEYQFFYTRADYVRCHDKKVIVGDYKTRPGENNQEIIKPDRKDWEQVIINAFLFSITHHVQVDQVEISIATRTANNGFQCTKDFKWGEGGFGELIKETIYLFLHNPWNELYIDRYLMTTNKNTMEGYTVYGKYFNMLMDQTFTSDDKPERYADLTEPTVASLYIQSLHAIVDVTDLVMGDDTVFLLEDHHGVKPDGLQFLGIQGREPFSNNVALCKRRYYPKKEDPFVKETRKRLVMHIQNFAKALIHGIAQEKKTLGDAVDTIAAGPSLPINGKPKTDLEKMIRAIHRLLNQKIQDKLQKNAPQYAHFQHNSQRPFWGLDILAHGRVEFIQVREEITQYLVKKGLIPSGRVCGRCGRKGHAPRDCDVCTVKGCNKREGHSGEHGI